jgi:hypothetical protein
MHPSWQVLDAFNQEAKQKEPFHSRDRALLYNIQAWLGNLVSKWKFDPEFHCADPLDDEPTGISCFLQ